MHENDRRDSKTTRLLSQSSLRSTSSIRVLRDRAALASLWDDESRCDFLSHARLGPIVSALQCRRHSIQFSTNPRCDPTKGHESEFDWRSRKMWLACHGC